jgi:hypothetical protein
MVADIDHDMNVLGVALAAASPSIMRRNTPLSPRRLHRL